MKRNENKQVRDNQECSRIKTEQYKEKEHK